MTTPPPVYNGRYGGEKMKISAKEMQYQLKKLSAGKLEDIAEVNFNEFMKKKNEKVEYVSVMGGNPTFVGAPSNFANIVLFWISETLAQHQQKVEDNGNVFYFPKGNNVTRTLFDFVELYGDISLEQDGEIKLAFPLPEDRNEFGERVSLITRAFKIKYADRIKLYEEQIVAKTWKIDQLFENMTKKNEDEAE